MQFHSWRTILFAVWLSVVCCPAVLRGQQESKRAGDGFVSLFDGKTLTGWNVEPKTKTSDWTVRDGVIVGHGGRGQSYLAWKDKGLADFELKLSYRLPRKGNTGGKRGQATFLAPSLGGHGGGGWIRDPVSGRCGAPTCRCQTGCRATGLSGFRTPRSTGGLLDGG